MKTYTFNNSNELLAAISGGVLNGYQPTKKINANELNYPISVLADTENKGFEVVSQGEIQGEVIASSKKEKIWQSPFFIFGACVAVLCIIVAIITYNEF